MTGRVLRLGDRDWAPSESSLRILEGSRLEGPDLAFGQGWSNAERSSRDVTREVLAQAEREAPPPATALEIEAGSAEEALVALAGGAVPQPLELGDAQAAIDRRDPKVAAIILVTRRRLGTPEPPRS